MSTTATNYPDPKAAAAYLKLAEEKCWELPGVDKNFPLPKIEKVCSAVHCSQTRTRHRSFRFN